MHLLLNHSPKLIIPKPTFIRFLKINFQWGNDNPKLPKTIPTLQNYLPPYFQFLNTILQWLAIFTSDK